MIPKQDENNIFDCTIYMCFEFVFSFQPLDVRFLEYMPFDGMSRFYFLPSSQPGVFSPGTPAFPHHSLTF